MSKTNFVLIDAQHLLLADTLKLRARKQTARNKAERLPAPECGHGARGLVAVATDPVALTNPEREA